MRGPFVVAATLALLLVALPSSYQTVAVAANGTWPTYQGDAARTGLDTSQTSFNTPTTAWIGDYPQFGQVYAQPLFFNDQVLVATEMNWVYALRPATGAVVWSQQLGAPVDAGSLPCGNIFPTVGITSTPVIDTAHNVLFAVAFLSVPDTHYGLFALDLARGGAPLSGYPVTLTGPNFDPQSQGQRGALAWNQSPGKVFIPFGGRAGDCGTYRGWVMSVDTGDRTLQAVAETTANGGGIWAPGGIALDGTASLWVSTGNTFGTSTYSFGESVLKVSSGNLSRLDSWAPSNWLEHDADDTDIGSLAPTLLPTLGLVFQADKRGLGYLLQMSALGGVGGERFTGVVCAPQEAIGTTAYDAATSTVYVPCSRSFVAVHVTGGANPSFSANPLLSGLTGSHPGANPPILAAGAVWEVGTNGTLYVFDRMTNMAGPTFSLPRTPSHFVAPSFGAGRLYIPSGTSVVAVRIGTVPVTASPIFP